MPSFLRIPVANAAELVALGYTRIEIWHTQEYANAYEEITAPTPEPATLDSLEATTLFRIGGKAIAIRIDGGDEESISFSSLIDFWTPAQVTDRINEVVPGLASHAGSVVTLTATATGRVSSLEITYSDADQLGFTAGTKVYGKDQRITLDDEQFLYEFTDVSGPVGGRYKWRFSAAGVNPISEYAAAVESDVLPIASAPLSVGYARLSNVSGSPLKTKIIVAPTSTMSVVGGYGIARSKTIVVDTDDAGFLQLVLVRGQTVKIAIEGTAFVRDVVVPNAPSFDILTAMAAAPDQFTVQTVPPFLIRRAI